MTSRASLTAGTNHTAAILLPPYTIPSRLPCDQVPIGCNLLNRRETVNLDMFQLYADGFIHNRNLCFVGDVGHGKSSTMKTLLERMLIPTELLPDGTERLRRAVIIDRKGEYRPLAELFDCQPVVVGHGQCLNPFDDRLDPQQQLGVLESALELLGRGPLDRVERKAATVAYQQAVDNHSEGPLLLADVRYALAHLNDESLAKLDPLPHDEVKRCAILLAFALDELLDGSLRGLFDGPTTAALDWAGQVVVVQVHPDYVVAKRELVYQLLVAVVAVWLDRAWQTPDPHRWVDFFVVDEAWDYVKVRQFAALLQDTTKLGRTLRLCVMVSFQGASDVDSSGNVGDVQRDMAKRLLKDVGGFFLFHQSREDAELLRGVAQLTDDDIRTVTNLEAHTYMLVVGSGAARRRLYVEHRLHPDEVALVDSDSR
jgi:hypothetical protein